MPKNKKIKTEEPETIKTEEPETIIEVTVEEPTPPTTKNNQKYELGSIVFLSKDADADLEGFKLFPQYKKYTYTVEAYDKDTRVYTLRRLNLSLKLQESFILAPNERAHDSLNRKQF